MNKKLLAIIHLVIVTVIYSSPFWLDWRLVGLGVILYWLQIIIFKACIISIAQYGSKEISFVGLYLQKFLKLFKIEVSMKNIRVFLNWILPVIIFATAYIFQASN